jgi:hypothetical protein
MLVTDAMLHAAIRKAVEVELLPRCGPGDMIEESWRQVKAVLEAALTEADDGRHATAPPPAEPFAHCRFVVHGEFLHGIDALTREPVYREVAMLGTDDRATAEWHAEDLARRSGRKAWVVDRMAGEGSERP